MVLGKGPPCCEEREESERCQNVARTLSGRCQNARVRTAMSLSEQRCGSSANQVGVHSLPTTKRKPLAQQTTHLGGGVSE